MSSPTLPLLSRIPVATFQSLLVVLWCMEWLLTSLLASHSTLSRLPVRLISPLPRSRGAIVSSLPSFKNPPFDQNVEEEQRCMTCCLQLGASVGSVLVPALSCPQPDVF